VYIAQYFLDSFIADKVGMRTHLRCLASHVGRQLRTQRFWNQDVLIVVPRYVEARHLKAVWQRFCILPGCAVWPTVNIAQNISLFGPFKCNLVANEFSVRLSSSAQEGTTRNDKDEKSQHAAQKLRVEGPKPLAGFVVLLQR
jgi:hypothetical protein